LLKCFGLKYFDETEILNTPGPGNRDSGIKLYLNDDVLCHFARTDCASAFYFQLCMLCISGTNVVSDWNILTRLKFWIRLALGTETRALEKSFNKHNRFSKVMIWQCDIVADGKAESFECDIYLNLFNPFMYMSTTKQGQTWQF
jgi:hypothetical protein